MTLEQVREASECLADGPPAKVSVFAGRIADTGRDPVPLMAAAVELLRPYPNLELIWASPRELLNIFQADAIGCHIITATTDVLKKLALIGKNLSDYSLDTVRMFYEDAQQSRLSALSCAKSTPSRGPRDAACHPVAARALPGSSPRSRRRDQ